MQAKKRGGRASVIDPDSTLILPSQYCSGPEGHRRKPHENGSGGARYIWVFWDNRHCWKNVMYVRTVMKFATQAGKMAGGVRRGQRHVHQSLHHQDLLRQARVHGVQSAGLEGRLRGWGRRGSLTSSFPAHTKYCKTLLFCFAIIACGYKFWFLEIWSFLLSLPNRNVLLPRWCFLLSWMIRIS